ncbi:glucose-6-phosphate dehydrogenase [uncultured Microbacterium sp.]|uniref:Glucose-6-phosphate 1-dehydrogenase n=1 Tax=uncultured Microbacterium sp. TaxID=191216 RepID=A0A1Y5NYW0_9MICO|nr:glucose-6-phosphate dehydrogenase [uncultured Microbacterium sp.]SBS71555.1 Glucose-6-phosphate 1-dehydrogenase [uncultured Microbacterium sp.]
MKITTSSDWRNSLPFETPMLVADLQPGEPTRCAGCGVDAAPHPRTELWAVKHRHPNNHAGFVRFYCATHRPEPTVAAIVETRRETARRDRALPPRRAAAAPVVERPVTLCPDCFVQVPPTGVCGMCGQKVA